VKELELTIRVKNNLIKQRRENAGLSQIQVAKGAGVSVSAIQGFELMHLSPIHQRWGGWTATARKLATFFEVEPETLFPEGVLAVVQPVAVRTVDARDVKQIVSSYQERVLRGPESELTRRELRAEVADLIGTLKEREQRVLAMRFGLTDGTDHTCEEVAEEFGVTRERIRQIEAKALRKLRHPSRVARLKPFVEAE